MGMQPANRVPTITAKKPLTLSSLGAGKVGFGGAKSVSLSASKPAAAKPAAPAAQAAPAVPEEKKETPAPEEKKEQPASPAVETLVIDTPAEQEEAPATSVGMTVFRDP